jgi:predicted O-methyltransferase YrrM
LQEGEDAVGTPPERAGGALAGRLARAVAELEHSPGALAVLSAVAATAGARSLPRAVRTTLGLAAAGAVGAHARRAGRLQRDVRSGTDAASLCAILGGAAPLFGRWAVEADFAGIVAREVEQTPGLVVELGSGATTLVIAAMLRRSGRGHLVSVEHDEVYAHRTRRALEAAGLADGVEVVVAPLREQPVAGRTVVWYDAHRVTEALDADVDLLVVDGPPQWTRWSRWPALPALHPHLAPRAVVLVDDGRTRAALGATRAWTDAFPDMERYWLDSVKGTWLLRRRAHDGADRGRTETLLKLVGALQPRPSGSGLWPVRR